MMEVQQVVNDIFASNCFIIASADAESILLVDPGSKENSGLLDAIGNRRIDYVVVTHGHFDHFASIGFLREKFYFQIIACRRTTN